MHAVKFFIFGSFLGLCLSCASTPDKAENQAQTSEAKKQEELKRKTAQERIYHAKFSGAFYDRF